MLHLTYTTSIFLPGQIVIKVFRTNLQDRKAILLHYRYQHPITLIINGKKQGLSYDLVLKFILLSAPILLDEASAIHNENDIICRLTETVGMWTLCNF